MTFQSWLRGLTHGPAPTLKKSRHSAARTRGTRHRPSLERLEDRTLLSLGFGAAFSLEGSGPVGIVDSGDAIAVDGVGNLYVLGHFYGTIDADPGPGTHLLTSAGGSDDFVAKYDPAGGLLWAARMGSPQNDGYFGGGDLAVDGSGNVFVTGQLQGTADFGSFTVSIQGSSDVFVAKLDATGTFQWATRMGASNDTANPEEEGFGIAADGLGNVYTTGRMVNPASSGGQIFVAKHDGNGNLLWLKYVGGAGAGEAQGNDLALDGAGNVYVTGQFYLTADFDPGPGTFNLSSTVVRGVAQYSDAFAMSLDSGGNFRWAFKVTGDKHDAGKGIAVDGSGNIYLAGDFNSTSNDFDPGKSKAPLTNAGGSDIFVAKYSSSRSLIWARSMGGPGGDVCNDIAVDGSGNVYTTGGFKGTADFDPGSGAFNLTSAGFGDIFVSQLNSAGNYVWAGRMGGTSGQAATAKDLALDGTGNVYTTGNFRGTVDFDPGAGTYFLTSTPDSSGNPTINVFVSKLVPSSTAPAAPIALLQASPTVTGPHAQAVNSIVTIPLHEDARHHTARTEAADQAIASLLGSATRRRLAPSCTLDLDGELSADIALFA